MILSASITFPVPNTNPEEYRWILHSRLRVPEIKGVWVHEAGFGRAFIVISIKQISVGHATTVGHIVATSPLTAYGGRYVILVDEDIDPSDLNQLIWAMCTRSDPAKSIEIINNVWSTPLDPMAERKEFINEYVSSRGITYALKPFSKIIRNQFPIEVRPSQELVKGILRKYKEIFE